MMFRRKAVLGLGHGEEFDGDQDGALVEKLEDGVLGIGARSRPM